MTSDRVDVLVVGGGPVGLFQAALLADRGLEVVVWERRTGAPTGSRAIGIHPPSVDAFARIGLDGPVLAEAVRVHSGTARSRGRELGTLRFDRASATHPYVLTLDQHRTESLLRERLRAAAPLALRVGTSLTALDRHPDHVVATGTGPEGEPVVLRSTFVVGADGARSVTRELLGIGTAGRDYPDRYVMGDFADVEGLEPARPRSSTSDRPGWSSRSRCREDDGATSRCSVPTTGTPTQRGSPDSSPGGPVSSPIPGRAR